MMNVYGISKIVILLLQAPKETRSLLIMYTIKYVIIILFIVEPA